MLRILIVCRIHSGQISPFILEQVNSLKSLGVKVDYFLVDQRGLVGYLKKRKDLLIKIKAYKPDIIHAHYGLSGLLANLQKKVPVVTTYHGSDINNTWIFPLSRICMMLSAYNIFVSAKNQKKSGIKRNNSIIPCGVDLNLFVPMNKEEAQKEFHFDKNKKYILFAGAFQNAVKNSELAINAVSIIPNVELLELNGYIREQVVTLMNAVDVVLMTSFTEGSPQFIKEAMACNCPIVSVPVGDVPEVIANLEGCYISTYDPLDVAEKLNLAIDFAKRTNGRKRIIELKLDTENIAKRIIEIYMNLITNSTLRDKKK
jgi:glycosyltransferase involved in cell wall biosynthesis